MAEYVQRSFRVFYRDYRNSVSISSSAPEPLASDRLSSLAGRLLESEDNFLGIIDDKEVVLQLYLDSHDQVILELLYPETQGCLRVHRSKEQAMALLDDLPGTFADDLLPGANYIG